jgi:uncharacterized membrane protein
MTTTAHELIDAYLRRLDAAAAGLPPARRAELILEIREHISVALAESPDQGEPAVRTVLDRLGDPEHIAREAGGADATAAPAGEQLSARRVLPGLAGALVLALLVLIGEVVGWVALLIAVVLGWTLLRWPLRQKLLIVVIWPVGLGLAASASAGGGAPIAPVVALAVVVGTFVVVHMDRKAA